MKMLGNLRGWLRIIYVAFAFCSAFFLGALKGSLVLLFYIHAFLFGFAFSLRLTLSKCLLWLHRKLKNGIFEIFHRMLQVYLWVL